MVSCQKGPTRHAYAWQIRPFWQDTLKYVWGYLVIIDLDNEFTQNQVVIIPTLPLLLAPYIVVTNCIWSFTTPSLLYLAISQRLLVPWMFQNTMTSWKWFPNELALCVGNPPFNPPFTGHQWTLTQRASNADPKFDVFRVVGINKPWNRQLSFGWIYHTAIHFKDFSWMSKFLCIYE